jgi:carbon storage regulator|tara:strand:+ start:1444 stop:1626 length:183 start_codon:yes stop_codon:yes gene_type:complete
MPLALTRRLGNQIMIGDDIIITIKKLKASSVVLSFDAPRNVKILRNEVYQRDLDNAKIKS